uniref:NADH-ubiquinone oxidoreductase chain 4L n=1 Tax=Malachiinae sp. GENSP01 TaxID=1205562 RepID=A0A0S2MQL1_9CUCU|nr:NADH deshydrogenase subunit 4L [Malachiinae sp. GENSP01]
MLIKVMYLMGWMSFSLKRKHLLLMLLSLEFLVLCLFYGLMGYFNLFYSENYFNLIFLSFSVCEGVLGLSLLVLMIRTHGNDYFQMFNILW